MSSAIFTVPTGQTLVFPAPARSSVCVQPAAAGSVTLAYGPDGVAPTFTAAPQSGNTSPFSLATDTYAALMGSLGKVQVGAVSGAATVIISDLSEYPGSFPERQTVAQSAVAYSSPNSTAELELFSIRFPAGYFKPNFYVECFYQLTLSNNVNVKTLKGYFGPSTNSATAGAIETAAAALVSNVYTSMSGAKGTFSAAGRNDGQTIIGSNAGLLSAGGWGSSVTANTTVSNAAYQTTEQVLIITGTKATGGDAFTLDQVLVKVYQ